MIVFFHRLLYYYQLAFWYAIVYIANSSSYKTVASNGFNVQVREIY